MASDAWSVPIGSGVWHIGDTFDVMRSLPPASVDMILCDLPYGTTQNKWDSVLPLKQLWAEYWRIARPNAAIVLTAAQPFTSALVMSQPDCFRYSWIWHKEPSGNLNAKRMPMAAHEDVLVFGSGIAYNPQGLQPTLRKRPASDNSKTANYGAQKAQAYEQTVTGYPQSVLGFPKSNRAQRTFHPTQKPVALFEYLIRTYTNPGDTVLDNTAGSGTTAVAAEQSGRQWICIERDDEYSLKAMARLAPYG